MNNEAHCSTSGLLRSGTALYPMYTVVLVGCYVLVLHCTPCTRVAGIDGYCFSGSPSLTCISLKFDLYVYL